MNNQKLWWSEVEERFRNMKIVNAIAMGDSTNSILLLNPETGRNITPLHFFHKEIQERLHEEAVDSELPK